MDRAKSAINLANLFKELVINVIQPARFYEIGAFDASTSIFIKNNLSECEVYAFEANPYNFKEFCDTAISNNVNYIHCAMSDSVGTAVFNIQVKKKNKEMSPIRGNNSLYERNEKGVHYEKAEISTETVDNYFKDTTDDLCLWIDVEGKGYEVLCGATSSLNNAKLILIEVESYQFWKDQKLDTDIIELLKSHNFLPVARDYETEHQYNILFCKESEASNPLIKQLIKEYQEKTIL